jgi:hypothetical protein
MAARPILKLVQGGVTPAPPERVHSDGRPTSHHLGRAEEVRLLAKFCRDPKLCDLLREIADIYEDLAGEQGEGDPDRPH